MQPTLGEGGLGFLALALSVFGFSQTVSLPSWQLSLQEGRELYDAEQFARAVPVFEHAMALARTQNAGELAVADVSNSLGAAYAAEGRVSEAGNMLGYALAVRQRLLPSSSVDLAISFNNQAGLLWATNQLPDAEKYANRALAIWAKLGNPERSEYVAALDNLAAIRRAQGNPLEAIKLLKVARRIREKSLKPGNVGLTRVLLNMGIAYQESGDLAMADKTFQEALLHAPGLPPAMTAELLNDLGNLRYEQGRFAEAESLVVRAIALENQMVPPDRLKLGIRHSNLGSVYRALGRRDDSRVQFEEALTIFKGLPERSGAYLPATLNNFGLLRMNEKRYHEAERLFREAISLWERDLCAPGPNSVAAYSNLAVLYQQQHRYRQAADLFQQVLAKDKGSLPPGHPRLARDLANVGTVEYLRHHYERAEDLLRESLEIRNRTFGPVHIETAQNREDLAQVLWAEKRLDEAERYYQEALQSLEIAWGPEDLRLLDKLERYAQLLHQNKHFAKAQEAEVQAVRIRVRHAIKAEHSKVSG
jgi:tetratricopeptide (TPR) repeat protein